MGGNLAVFLLFIASFDIICVKTSVTPKNEDTVRKLASNEENSPFYYSTNKPENRYENTTLYSHDVDNASVMDERDATVSNPVTPRENRRHQMDSDRLENRKNNVAEHSRPLTAGDIFTPPEFLPIAEKLIAKVEDPGQGKGIVSSSKNPQDLADKLFENFFYTKKRFVTLKAFDISGLDALQALALSGEDASLRSYTEPQKESIKIMNFRDQDIAVDTEPKRSKYTLLKKKDNIRIKKKIVLKRGKENKSWKKSPIVKTAKFEQVKFSEDLKKNDEVNVHKKGSKSHEPVHHEMKSSKGKSITPACTWQYKCSRPGDLDSCQLHSQCSRRIGEFKKSDIDALGISHRPDEHSHNVQLFRKMAGIAIIDEEVEKIFEGRSYLLKPQYGGRDLARLESMSEYFDKLIMAQHTTEPYSPPTESLPNSSYEHKGQESTAEDGRRILGIPTIPTLEPHKVIN